MDPAEAALGPVEHDVAAVFTSILDSTTAPPATVVLLGPEGTRWEVVLDLNQEPAARIVDFAKHVQDLIADLQHGHGLPAAWPPCPAHPDGHPLTARVERGIAVWVCPAGAGVPVPIGALPPQWLRIGFGRAPMPVPRRPDGDEALEPVIADAHALVLRDLRTRRCPTTGESVAHVCALG